ncbi:MAG: hypothetical protein J0I12_31940 [Candidatus Eremiobacteraeota bacterium]|nr:hypothetical protein [Candidatus Eremiobacteraeota bacterium]
MHFKLARITSKIWLTAALLMTPAQAAPLLPSTSYTGVGDVTNTSFYGGTIGIDDASAVNTRFVAGAFSNGARATPANDLKVFLGLTPLPGNFNRGSGITATYLNVQAGDLLEFLQSDVDLGDKPDLQFLVTFYDLVNDQLYINPVAINPAILHSLAFPNAGDFLVGFSLIQTGGSTARLTVTLSEAPELNPNWAALPLTFLIGILLVHESPRRKGLPTT